MQTRYSPIAPIHLLEELFSKGILGNYLLLLAHDVLAHPQRYASLMDAMRDSNEHSMVIMDNSVVELGVAMSLRDVIKAADITSANCIMTPDVLGNFSRTQAVVEKWKTTLIECHYPLMRVPQGSSIEDLLRCVEWLRFTLPIDENLGDPELWGIPRWITNKLGSRKSLVEFIGRTSDVENVGIHLLGMSQNFADDMVCANMPNVMGIDSANPLVAGLADLDFSLDKPKHLDRGDYWNTPKLTPMMISNVEYVQKYVSG